MRPATAVRVEPVFGPSTALQERLANGEPGDILTSADMSAPEALVTLGKSAPAVEFARNHLCAILRPGLTSSSPNILKTMLDPAVRIATSTPHNDPGGDYAWSMFARADAVTPGSRAILEAKAIKIGTVPGSLAVPPAAGNPIVWLFNEKRADVFIAYCTSGRGAAQELAGISNVDLPPSLAVEARYGLTVLSGRMQLEASRFAFYILSPAGQRILATHGFDAPLM